jgi:hypothetical protein
VIEKVGERALVAAIPLPIDEESGREEIGTVRVAGGEEEVEVVERAAALVGDAHDHLRVAIVHVDRVLQDRESLDDLDALVALRPRR